MNCFGHILSDSIYNLVGNGPPSKGGGAAALFAKLTFQWHACRHPRPFARSAIDRERAADLRGALAHACQSEMAFRACRLRMRLPSKPQPSS